MDNKEAKETKESKKMGPAIHNIGLCGLTGIIFAVLTSSLILYLEGFVTTSWSVYNTTHYGLWQVCVGQTRQDGAGWLVSVQTLSSLGLFGLIVAFGLSVIYMTANRASKNISIMCLAAVCLLAGILMSASVIIYGVKREADAKLSWSYFVTVVATILSFLAAILAILQARRSNVRCL
jgi:hypothetical protein